ncbi:diacylglycerol O-acyltransferase 3 [Diospyros lotus]|uniref:diacylglycerol O-acyltransferase 3 n=1 Tax=Diospyros lotus TaxID=55363 RepID=UPI0022580739|nr:diacylglycerol O-acyltransferase 3 [Diospyros lotus]
MEASGVLRPLPFVSGGVRIEARPRSFVNRLVCVDSQLSGRRNPGSRKFCGFSNSGFCDNAYRQYYCGKATPAAITCDGKKKEKVKEGSEKKTMKKRLKLLRGLSKDLSLFSEMGFGLDPENRGLVDEVKGKMITEATELLLKQLEQLRAEEEDLKRKRKEEKAKARAVRTLHMADCEESSSSSSSESSDGECSEVLDMKTEARLPLTATKESKPESIVELQPIQKPVMAAIGKAAQESGKRVEVCMGGKCKKSGSEALLGEFQRLLGGGEAAAVGCKCMGKCRDGPNVRVLNCDRNGTGALGGDESVRKPSNPLCIGVGLEDVALIVDKFFGEIKEDAGLAAAS